MTTDASVWPSGDFRRTAEGLKRTRCEGVLTPMRFGFSALQLSDGFATTSVDDEFQTLSYDPQGQGKMRTESRSDGLKLHKEQLSSALSRQEAKA